MGGGTDINYPAQPSYGEGMAEAMKAQMEQLLGQGDYADIYKEAGFAGGNLGDILTGVEAPIRKQTAQIDTDVLRQTLLGSEQQTTQDEDGRWGIAGTEVMKDEAGEALSSSGGRYQIIKTSDERALATGLVGMATPQDAGAGYSIIDTQTGGLITVPGETAGKVGTFGSSAEASAANLKNISDKFNQLKLELRASEGPEAEAELSFTFTNPNIPINPDKAGQAGYDSEGRKFLRKGDTARTTTGMVDLVGDSRAIKSATKQDDYESYVRDDEDNMAAFQAENTRLEAAGEAPMSVEQWGKAHYEASGKAAGDKMPTKYGYAEEDPGRRAGFDPTGEFLGLSAFGEDIQAQNLSRQRQRDLEDVARLSPLYSDIMEDFKPGTKEALESARGVLEAREGALTGSGGSLSDASTQVRESYLRVLGREPDAAGLATWTEALQNGASVEDMNLAFAQARAGGDAGPVMEGRLQAQARALGREAPTSGLATGAAILAPTRVGEAAKVAYEAKGVGDPAEREAVDPSYTADQSVAAGRIGGDYEATESRGTGDIRAALMEDAFTGLGEGLTAREQEQIEQASRRRATALGRAFDRGSIADEVQSRVLEDRNRQAQNRAYAQQVLGQEAGLQTSDLGRNLQADLANQQAINRQKEFGVGAALQQESLALQQEQQRAMADAQAINRQREYGVGAGLQQQQFEDQQDIARQAMNREATMKASEFDILQNVARGEQNIGRELAAAESDMERDYRQRFSQEQLAQQGTMGYIDATAKLAALEDTRTLNPIEGILGRSGGGSLSAGNQLFGTAQYGLQSGPQYLNPESGLGFIQNQATNAANMFNTQQSAGATRDAGMMGMLGSLGGAAIGLCWVAREVYGAHNPAWLDFRQWMFSSAPKWFFKLYLTFGERFANFISNKPRLKARIRMWMDTKIGR